MCGRAERAPTEAMLDPGRKQVQRRSADRFAIDVIDVSAALKAQTRRKRFCAKRFLVFVSSFLPPR
jgi:hypothetical protein